MSEPTPDCPNGTARCQNPKCQQLATETAPAMTMTAKYGDGTEKTETLLEAPACNCLSQYGPAAGDTLAAPASSLVQRLKENARIYDSPRSRDEGAAAAEIERLEADLFRVRQLHKQRKSLVDIALQSRREYRQRAERAEVNRDEWKQIATDRAESIAKASNLLIKTEAAWDDAMAALRGLLDALDPEPQEGKRDWLGQYDADECVFCMKGDYGAHVENCPIVVAEDALKKGE